MKLITAIEEASALAYEEDRDQYVISEGQDEWRIVDRDDPQAYAPGVGHRFLVHSDGVDRRHIDAGEITEDWEIPSP